VPKVGTCEKLNCNLPPHDADVWHVKKGPKGKIIISWLNGEWKASDGSTGTYRYQDPVPLEADSPLLEDEPKFGTKPNLPFPSGSPA
jgi:hypothetical protein